MSNSDIFVSLAYALYVIAPGIRDELWLRTALFINSFGFAVWGLWIGSWPVVIANILFCLMSLRQMHRAYNERRPAQLCVDAATIGAPLFPAMGERDLELLWKAGEDLYAENVPIITLGEEVDKLYILLDGDINVCLPDGSSYETSRPTILGEISALSANRSNGATATVTANNARFRCWDQQTLEYLQENRPTMVGPFLKGLSAQMAERVIS